MEFIKLCHTISKEIIHLMTSSKQNGINLGQEIGIGADGDPTYKIDALAEDKAIELIEKTDFHGKIITEERGIIQIGTREETIWLDPIDGSRNCYRNIPYYALSIALFQKAIFINGFIQNLANGDEFLSYNGMVTLNRKPVKTIPRPLHKVGIIAIRPETKRGFKCLQYIQENVQFIRIMGAAALDIAYITSGAVDAFLDLERGLKTVDYAAAQPLLELAGGVVSDLQGKSIILQEDLTARATMLASSNTNLHSKLLKLLQDFKLTT